MQWWLLHEPLTYIGKVVKGEIFSLSWSANFVPA